MSSSTLDLSAESSFKVLRGCICLKLKLAMISLACPSGVDGAVRHKDMQTFRSRSRVLEKASLLVSTMTVSSLDPFQANGICSISIDNQKLHDL